VGIRPYGAIGRLFPVGADAHIGPPGLLFRQKSEIFATFPRGEGFLKIF